MLTLTIVWVAIRFSAIVTGTFCVVAGAVGVWLTIARHRSDRERSPIR